MAHQPLDDQILAVLRDEGPETARYVTMRLYGLTEYSLRSWAGNRSWHLPAVEARIGSLRRRGLLVAAGKNARDSRQNTYALTTKARALAPAVEDLPPLTVRGRS